MGGGRLVFTSDVKKHLNWNPSGKRLPKKKTNLTDLRADFQVSW